MHFIKENDFDSGVKSIIYSLNSNLIEIRDLAEEVLLKINLDAIPIILKNFSMLNGEIRKTLVKVLAIYGEPSVIEILDLIEDEPEYKIRKEYYNIIGEVGSPIALPYLLKRFNEEIRRKEIEDALVNIGEPASLEIINEIYKENDEIITSKLIKIVCKIGGTPVLKLIPLTYDRKNKRYFPDIISALEKFDDKEAKKTVEDYYEIIKEERGNKWKERARETKRKIFQ